MNVLLTHGYFLKDDLKEQQIMRPYPPLGILYISAYLDEHGVDNQIYDTTFSDKQSLKDFLVQEQPLLLAVYVNLMTKLNVLEIMDYVRNCPELQRTKIVLGGPEVRASAENFLNHGADFIVLGEGEETTLELVQSLQKPGFDQWKLIHSIAYKDASGKVVHTEERGKIKDIDELPFANRGKINLDQYLQAWKDFHGANAVSVSTMRGCPYTCKWCSRAVYGLSYRRRSPALVVEELQLIRQEYNPDTLWFVDDVFTVSHKWLREFQQELERKQLKIPYECITRADRLNEEVIRTLKDTGCFRIWIGAESGSQKVIDLMDRRVDVHQVRDMIRLAQKYEIQAGTFIMLGYPGETEEDIEETIHHLKASNPDHFTITVAYPIRGTELFQEVEAIQTKELAWDQSTDRDIDFKRTYSRKYYDFALSRVNNEMGFYKNWQRNGMSLDTAKFKLKSVAAKMGMQWEKMIKS